MRNLIKLRQLMSIFREINYIEILHRAPKLINIDTQHHDYVLHHYRYADTKMSIILLKIQLTLGICKFFLTNHI